MLDVAVASGSRISADAGARVASEGGNAVDAAIAASLVSTVTEPGVCSLAAGGFLTIWPPDGDPVTVDGASAMAGLGLPPERLGQGGLESYLEYGGGMHTTVGYGSVAVPGAPAAWALASERFGRLPWHMLVEPAYEWARNGFPLSQASRDYLELTHEGIFGWNPHSFAALHDADGRLYETGETIRIEHLADSLRAMADAGVSEFYTGELGRAMADDIVGNGGILSRDDLAGYRARVERTLEVRLDDWRVATNPPPAVGGATLAAMLMLMGDRPQAAWTPPELEHLIRVQEAVLRFRREQLDCSDELWRDVEQLMERASLRDLKRFMASPSTVHASAVDSNGLACAVTVSAGYGSGVMPPGTGVWMNNCLGELELNKRGFHAWRVGTRLPSNMAPTVARRSNGAVLAIGSPGADRITSAILQTVVNFMHLEMPLQAAVDYPRLHVEEVDGRFRVAYETGLPVDELDVEQRRFEGISMFFGGVSAACWDPEEGFLLAGDPRRAGGTAMGSSRS